MADTNRNEHRSVMEAPDVQPESDRAWSIETSGINSISDAERHGKPSELFWVWFAANMGITALPFGAYLVTFYQLNIPQAILAAVIGCLASYYLVGLVGIAGTRAGAPTMIISRASFGVIGNALPTIVSYIVCIGFEILLMSIATLAFGALLTRLGVGGGNVTLAISFAIAAGITIAISLLGHSTIVKMQTLFTWIYGILIIPFFFLSLHKIHAHAIGALHAGPFLAGFIGGISIIAVGLGVGWVNVGADYTRYLPRNSSTRSLVGWTVVGSSIAPIILIVFGALLAASNPDLASSGNPIELVARPLPTWFLVPFLIAVAVGLIAAALTEVYSSGLALLTLGLRVPRYKSVMIDGALMIVGVVYIVFYAPSLFGAFAGFVVTLAAVLAPWVAVFLVDMWLYRRSGYVDRDLYDPSGRYGAWNWAGVTAFVVSSVVALGLVTSTAPAFSWVGYFLGPFGGKAGAVGSSNLGAVVGFFLAGILYAFLSRLMPERHATTGASGAVKVPASTQAGTGQGGSST